MLLSKFTFSNFRSFTEEQIVTFATPVDDKPGSGITYVVGENNAGKTSVLEAMHFLGHHSYGHNRSSLRTSDVKSNAIHFTFYDNNGEVVQNLTLKRHDSYSLKSDDSLSPNDFMSHYPLFIPSRRYWSPIVVNEMNIDNVKVNLNNRNIILRQRADGGMDNQIADTFYAIEEDDAFYQRFVGMMQEVFPDFEAFTITNEDQAQVSYKMANTMHRADFLGDGVASVMLIIALMVLYDDRMLVIDEPELSLHPEAQKRLKKVLAKAAQRQQIVLSTHSPHMVDWKYIENGAILHRVVKDQNNTSSTYTMQEYPKYRSLLNGGNWKQPYLVDAVAKEIFFSDNILFLEGQDDVGLLRDDGVLDDKINLFGYGVRGFTNFAFALQLAKDIGIKKAGVIIDKGDNEDAMVQRLKHDFPKYCIVQWDREDIRDKTGYCDLDDDGKPILSTMKTPKKGYFTVDGKKKEDTGDYDVKIQTINGYFRSEAGRL